MALTQEFSVWLSGLLEQIAKTPDALPAIPLDQWPVGSEERRVLEGLRKTLAGQHEDLSVFSTWDDGDSIHRRMFEEAGEGLILHHADTGQVIEANPAACRMYGTDREQFIGQFPVTFIYPDSASQFTKYIHAIQSQGTFDVRQVHMRLDGSPFFVELSGTIFLYQGRWVLLSVIRDVSQRIHSERLLQQRVDERTREQSTLLAISQTLASALELQPGLILDQLRVIIDYTHAGLFILEDSTLVALAVRGLPPPEPVKSFQIRLQKPEALEMLFTKRQPTRIADVQSSAPQAQFLRSLVANKASLLVEGVHSWMWVPLAIKGRMIGAVGVAHTTRDFFTAHHADLALIVANQAAITMVNAELYENAQALAALQERQRLAQNLHDAVNQSLFSAGLIAEVLPRLWEQDPEEGRRSLEDLRRLTRGAQADLRLLLAELRPSTLTDAELGDLLRLLGNALAGRTNLPVGVSVSGEGRLPAGVQFVFYRLCQESLNNIARHAGASQVRIDLKYEPDAVRLSIRDDGRGFDHQQVLPGHYGLSMMQERAASVDAVLSINSGPGKGTEVVIHWTGSQEQKAGE